MEAKELIGKKILNLFTDYTISGKSDCTVQQIYLELENIGIVTIPDADNCSKILMESNDFKLHQDNLKVAGSRIIDVLISEMLPFYNLSLSNGILIFCDSPMPDRFNWQVDYFSEKYKNQYEYKSLLEL